MFCLVKDKTDFEVKKPKNKKVETRLNEIDNKYPAVRILYINQ